MPLSQSEFTTILHWLVNHGYPLMLLAMIVEGPVVIMAASFAASLGVFNVAIVFALAVAGDLIGDLICFAAGYFGWTAFLAGFRHRFQGPEETMEKLRRLVERHPGKTLLAIKLSPFAAVPGLLVMGGTHMSPTKFAATAVLIIVPKTILFVGLGYFFGNAYRTIAAYINSGTLAFLIVLVMALLSYALVRRVSGNLSRKVQD